MSVPGTIEFEPGVPVRRVHCVGVGGMGMGPLAVYFAGLGLRVTGEDDALNPVMRPWLDRAGVAVVPPGTLPVDTEWLVYSSAITDAHPARVAARARGVVQCRRGEALACVARDRRLIAVAGAHGKTTTTAMLIWALQRAGVAAGWVLGGLYVGRALAPAAPVDAGGWLVAEVDESDGTIERFYPAMTVITSTDWDHPDYYPSGADLRGAYERLVSRTSGRVFSVVEAGFEGALTIGRGAGCDYELMEAQGAHPQRLELGGAFGETCVVAEVRAAGAFNATNAALALAAACAAGATLRSDLLADFPGVQRRQSVLSDDGGVLVIEDYAHHPVEVSALLASLRARVPAEGRLVVAFQPHRFSRTARFLHEFVECLAQADSVHLLDVYGAGESPMPGGTTADLAAALGAAHPELSVRHAAGSLEAFVEWMDADVRQGDVVAIVGAGDIDAAARRWLARRHAPEGDDGRRDHWDALAAELHAAVPTVAVTREEPLGRRTTMGVGGPARLYAEPTDSEELGALWREARARGVPVWALGRGSNLLVTDEGVDGLVVSLGHEAWQRFEVADDGTVWAGAGLRLKELCGLAVAAGMTGFEFLEGIPGTVGGALRMNAGAMGGWMFDVVQEVEFMTPDGVLHRLARERMHVDYRLCVELKQAIALGARLRPSGNAPTAEIRQRIEDYRSKRQETQPRERSAGCIFKNPQGDSAGRIIDQLGLKGLRIGDAEVSTTHANFIINRGAARAHDVLALVRAVRAEVRARRGIDLEPEVLLFGRDWEDVL